MTIAADEGAAHQRSEEERSRLCVACGLCCQGVLHDLVPLDEDEGERALALHLPVIDSLILHAFRLPCPRLDERRCTVYEERPRTCASYTCGVLDAYAAGAIELDEALGRVDALRAAPNGPKRRELRVRWFDR